MTSKFLSLLFGAIALSLCSCSTVAVNTDFDRTVDFTNYRTYSLASAQQGRSLSPSSENALRSTLRQGLAERGMQETSGSQADVSVVRHAFVQEKISVQQYTDWGYGYGASARWPYYYGGYHMWAGAPMTYTDVREYTEGTLVLDFVDNHSQKLIYRGIGKGTLSSPERNTEKVAKAVSEIVAQFPKPKIE